MTKNEIYEELSRLPNVKVVRDHVQLLTRCVLCGDSEKNPNKMRLYIKCDVTNPTEPVLYDCFNCGESGVLTPQMIKDIGCSNQEIVRGLKQVNSVAIESEGNVKVSKYRNLHEIKVEIPPLTKNPVYLRKAKYFLDRIGYPSSLELKDFEKLKIVWSLWNFLKINGIKPINGYTDILDKDYIGFLSARNEYIIFRDITEKHKMRYVKYNIFGVYDNSNSFYTIKNKINPLTQNDVHIIVSEGPFDIISILYNIFDGCDTDRIFSATCNGQYINTLRYYLDKGLVGSNIYIDIYRDNDNDKFMNYKKLKQQLKPYTKNYHVYYNTLNKDFGVPKNKIDVDIFM